MSYYQTMYGTDDVDTKLPVEKIAKINGFSRENEPIIELGDELIRCKGCKHRPKKIGEGTQGFDLEFPDWKCPCQCDDGWYNWMPEDDWYCGNGERKTQ